MSISAGDQQYRRLFEHFRRLDIGRGKRKKQRSLENRFKKKIDKIKRVVYFQNISANFKFCCDVVCDCCRALKWTWGTRWLRSLHYRLLDFTTALQLLFLHLQLLFGSCFPKLLSYLSPTCFQPCLQPLIY